MSDAERPTFAAGDERRNRHPLEILRGRKGRPRALESDEHATVYEVTVDGTVGIPALSAFADRPDALEPLGKETNAARVPRCREGEVRSRCRLT
jgi:hypothetical protein